MYFYAPRNCTFHSFWIAFKSFLNTVLKTKMHFVEKKAPDSFRIWDLWINSQMRLRCRNEGMWNKRIINRYKEKIRCTDFQTSCAVENSKQAIHYIFLFGQIKKLYKWILWNPRFHCFRNITLNKFQIDHPFYKYFINNYYFSTPIPHRFRYELRLFNDQWVFSS